MYCEHPFSSIAVSSAVQVYHSVLHYVHIGMRVYLLLFDSGASHAEIRSEIVFLPPELEITPSPSFYYCERCLQRTTYLKRQCF